jgi:CelD/BcsL family acetyltransferase involved in cellulose biosynthesis
VSLVAETRGAPPPVLPREWDALADRCAAGPFARPGWVDAWRAAFGGGEPATIAAHRDGCLSGLLPMVGRLGLLRSPTNAHTPAFAPLAEDAAALGALAGALVARRPPAFSIGFLDQGEPAVAAFADAARSAGYAVVVRPIHASPVLVLGDVDRWEAQLPRRALADLRRRMRRLREAGEVSVTRARDPQTLDDVLELEARGWKGTRGTAITGDARLRTFYVRVAGWAAPRGGLRIAVLRLDGRPLAALLALEEAGVLHLLKAGYDPAFARFSPGQLLLQDVLREAFAARLQRVELHGADEPYKRLWTGAVRRRVALEAFAPTAPGRLAHAAATGGRSLARQARELSPRPTRRRTS